MSPDAGLRSLTGQRVVVTGAAGQLGRYLVPALRAAGAEVDAFARQPGVGIDTAIELTDLDAVVRAIAAAAPDVVIHAAACTDVDGIERDPERGELGNARATRHVAEAARRVGAYLLAVGTDMVFAGDGGAPYREDGAVNPNSAYGRSKLAAERVVLEADRRFAVARTAWLYGGAGKHFPRTVLTVLRDRGGIDVVDDEWGSPTFAGDLAETLVGLAAVQGAGVFHLVNEGCASRFALARATARHAGFDPNRVRPVSTADFLARYPLPARRPVDSTLANRRASALGITLRPWEDALRHYAPELGAELGIGADNVSIPGG
jgi:dTDP-4-dehydrorhamnose reductase